MTPETIAELRRLLDAATPRPWSTVSGAGNVWHFPEDGAPTVVAGHQRAPRVPDAILIAAAVNALPALLDAAAELPALLDAATERDALAAKVERVRALPTKHPAGGWYMTSMRDVLAALDEEAQP